MTDGRIDVDASDRVVGPVRVAESPGAVDRARERFAATDANDGVPRPAPTPRVSDRAREWIEWFGLSRLVTSAIAVAMVCGGAYWLVRAPAPPTESVLPRAVADPAAIATLVPPSAAPTPSDLSRPSGMVVVHVAGAVDRPGVYELAAESRVGDAIEVAGGASSGAAIDVLNLAAQLADGSRVYVPLVGEEVTGPLVAGDPSASATDTEGPIDVNRSSAGELEALPGIGPATAAAIVTERERNGPFASFEDLDRVPGIGPAKLEALSGLVTT